MGTNGAPSEKVVVITIHGTNDQSESAAGAPKKWWEHQSDFLQRLQQRLQQSGAEADAIAFKWSGENNVVARERGAWRLAKLVRRNAKKYHAVHLVGHSHGGNVANDAAVFLRWGRNRKRLISSITTVGTPFLSTPHTLSQRVGAYIFFAVSVVSAIGLVALMAFSFWQTASDPDPIVTALKVALLAVGSLVFWLMISEAIQGVRRVSRFTPAGSQTGSFLSLWHPADEAISALNNLEGLKVEPFGRGTLLQGSRTSAILWAVRALVVFIAAVAILAVWAGLSGIETVRMGDWVIFSRGQALGFFGYALLFAWLFWIGVYVAYRLVFGLVPELAFRGWANRQMKEVMLGMAFGSVGDQRPNGVGTCSASFPFAREVALSGELEARIRDRAKEGVDRFLDVYRWKIFAVQGAQPDLFDQIAKDIAVWDSLVHTTYFDQPEIADMVADHILSVESPPSAPAPA